MHARTRRGIALVAAAATLGAGSLTTAAQATRPAGTTAASSADGPLLGLIDLNPLLGQVLSLTIGQLQTQLRLLSSTEIGDLLTLASAGELQKLIGALDPAQLTSALATLSPSGLASILGALTPAQIASLGGTTPGAATSQPATPPAMTAPAQSTPYRASLGTIKVARSRKSATVRLHCPRAAPRGCLISLTAAVAGRDAAKSVAIVLLRNATTTVTVKLSKSAGQRLRKKGGTLKVSAATMLSSLPPASRSVEVGRATR